MLIEEMSKLENAKLEDIIRYIKKNHGSQRRKFGDKEKYWNHPLRVFTHIYNLTDDYNLAASALLHDTLEDTGIPVVEIEDLFGTKIANITQELTSDKNAIKKYGKTKYLISKMNSISDNALTIKLVDRLDNLSDLNIAPAKWVEKYVSSTYSILANVKPRNSIQKSLMKLIYKKITQYEDYLN